MDYLRFHCPVCNHLLVVPPEAAGMTGPCPECQTLIQGPSYDPQPQSPNPPAQEPTPPPPPPPIVSAAAPLPPTNSSPPDALDKSYEAPDPVSIQSPASPQPSPQQDFAVEAPAPHPPARTAAPEPPVENVPPPVLEDKTPYPVPPPRRRIGPSLLQTLALCGLFSIAFFSLGFYLGKTGSLSWSEIATELRRAQSTQNDSNTAESSSTLPRDSSSGQTPELQIEPLPTQPEGPDQDDPEARASLEAFLSAGSWSARNAYVLFPNSVISEMEACSLIHSDGPIPYESLTLYESQPDVRVYWIKTPNNAHSFSTALIREQGRWLVDWSAFADFYHNRLHSFATGKKGPNRSAFRVFLKAAPGETAPLSPARCLVTTPQSDLSHQVNSAPDTQARDKLAEIFQAYLQSRPDTFNALMAEQGIPLIIELSRTSAAQPALQLESVIATSWAPLAPAALKKDSSSSFY